jgi:hypothetical protein
MNRLSLEDVLRHLDHSKQDGTVDDSGRADSNRESRD